MTSNFFKAARALVLALPFALTQLGSAQADPGVIQRIVDEGKWNNHVMDHLTYLTQRIGPRLTSSTNLRKAQEWAMGNFKKWGLTNVHLDKWGEFPVGFDRGKNHVGRMVSPERKDFEFTTQSWTEGTHGLKRGQAVLAPATMDEFNAMKGQLKGKWIVLKTAPPRGRRPGPGGAPAELTPEEKARQDLATAIDNSDGLGKVYPSSNELTITSGSYRDKTFEKHPMNVSIMIRKSDMDAVVADLDAKKNVVLEFNLDQKFVKGPIPQYNVVADIVGSEKPDEIVIVSGHLDSWDGPGSQGALDNGTGSCTALEAARILSAVKAKPKRTIRFILWSGEEEGLFGSAGYVKNHPEELDKISAVLVDDGGTNYQGGYEGIASQKDIFEAAIDPVNKAFPSMPSKFVVRDRMPRGGGSDHASFNAVGVPGFFTIETGRSNYGFVHHTQHDRLEMAIPEYLIQSSTNHAVVSYTLACLPTLLPREPKAAPAGSPPPR